MISFDVNNGGKLIFDQDKHDSDVIAYVTYGNGEKLIKQTISNGDMVMLFNLYTYVKSNDIQNDFINYYGKNKETQNY
jgi:hypothetical protein